MNLKSNGASFTLVEMLVGIAVFSLLMLLLLAIMGNATQLWRQQGSKEQSFREARAALNTLSRDMNGALVSTNPAWFYSDGTKQLAFLTTLPVSAQGSAQSPSYALGDICAVGYSLEWGTNDASGYQTNMSLYRYVCFSNPTYTNFIQGTQPVENIFIPANVDGTNTVRELIARDVSQFSITPYTNDPSGVPWVSNQGFLSNMMLNVGLVILNDRAAMLLKTQVQWQNTNSPIIQKNEESFTLRVRPQGP